MQLIASELLVSSYVLPFVALVIGLCVGSFLNVVIYRLPLMLEQQWQKEAAAIRDEPQPELERINLALPRSRCPHCGHEITPLENIPVLSYILLRGRCAHCKAVISYRYPLIEVLTGCLSALVAYQFGPTSFSLAALFFVWSLIALTFIDLDTQLLPDDITLPLMWGGILFNLITQTTPLEEAVIGAVAGYLSLWSVYWLFKLATGKEGMGYGDFKLLAAIGAFLGWKILPSVILISSIVGAVVGIGLILFTKHGRDTPIPFGPYLATAGLLSLFFGSSLSGLVFPLPL